MKHVKNVVFTLAVVSLAGAGLVVSGCATLTSVAGAAGYAAPKTQEVELSVGQVCPNCSAKSHRTLNPFPEPVKYTKVGIADIDAFNTSANNLYGSVLVAEVMLHLGKQMVDDPDLAVEGFNSRKDLLSLANSLVATAATDVPNLLTQGQSIATNVGKFADPSMALALPAATDQVALSLERLNLAQEKLAAMARGETNPAKAGGGSDAAASNVQKGADSDNGSTPAKGTNTNTNTDNNTKTTAQAINDSGQPRAERLLKEAKELRTEADRFKAKRKASAQYASATNNLKDGEAAINERRPDDAVIHLEESVKLYQAAIKRAKKKVKKAKDPKNTKGTPPALNPKRVRTLNNR